MINIPMDHCRNNTSTPILCLLPGPAPLSATPGESEFWALSEHLHGFVLSPVWKSGIAEERGQPKALLGSFEYYTEDTFSYPALLRLFINLHFYITKGRALHKRAPFQVIVAYGPFTTALAGYVLKKLTGAKLIVEFPGNPLNSFLLNAVNPSLFDRVKTWASRIVSPIAVTMADHLRLLYKEQLDGIVSVDPHKISAFHYYTAIKHIVPSEQHGSFVLAMGYPWYRKGIDLLIKAFLQICDDFPEIKLRVVGFTPDRQYYEELAAGHPRIELCRPVSHPEAIDLIRQCQVFACPSRSEGFPRVIVEAMAAARPVVAAAVDGIPSYIQDNVSGLLFQSEDVAGLAEKLSLILRDAELARRIGNAARIDALQSLTEDHYADYYREMVLRTKGQFSWADSELERATVTCPAQGT